MTSANSIPASLELLEEDTEILRQWIISDKLTLNTMKTEFVIMSSRAKTKEIGETLCVHVQGETIYKSPYAKSLGFYIDQQLDCEDHVAHVIKKCNSGLAVLRNAKGTLPKEALRTIYRSLIESHLQYGITVCGNRPLHKRWRTRSALTLCTG